MFLGAFYLQNIYHSSDDRHRLDDVLKVIDSYGRTALVGYQQYRRDCFRDNTIELEQVHLIFKLSVFQGYALQYKFNDGEQFELFIQLKSLDSIRSNQVKRFDVNFS